MKNKILLILMLIVTISVKSQVLITESDNSNLNMVEPSAVLEVRSDKKGILLPEVALSSNTDNVTVPTPVDGVNVHSTTQDRYMFWYDGRWYRNFTLEDVDDWVKISTGYVAEQSNKTDVGSFPPSMPLFSLGSGTNGWTDLGVSTTVLISKPNNTIAVNAEGMAAINNRNKRVPFQFAIGLFVDNKLVLVRKFYQEASATDCMWKQFNLSGIFENIDMSSQEEHTIKVMAHNLPRLDNNYTRITYGDKSADSCDNLNQDMAKTVLTVSVTQ